MNASVIYLHNVLCLEYRVLLKSFAEMTKPNNCALHMSYGVLHMNRRGDLLVLKDMILGQSKSATTRRFPGMPVTPISTN